MQCARADPADPRDVLLQLRVRLRNEGERPSREVVQVYAEAPADDAEAAPKVLAGFAVARAGAGKDCEVRVSITARALARYVDGGRELTVDPRALHVARSSRERRLRLEYLPADRDPAGC